MAKIENEQNEPKEPLMSYFGLWVGGIGGNLPVALFSEEVMDAAKQFAEQVFPLNHIFAQVKMPERGLVNRSNIRGIKQFAVNTLLEMQRKEDKVEQ